MITIAEAVQDATGTHVGISKEIEIEAGTRLELRPVPIVMIGFSRQGRMGIPTGPYVDMAFVAHLLAG